MSRIARRLERLRGRMAEKGIDAVLVCKCANLRYFSGFSGDSAMLVISRSHALLVTDSRYVEQAAQQASLFEVVEQKKGLLAKTAECVKALGCTKVGFEGNALLYDDFAKLQELLAGVDFRTSLRLDDLRQIKDEEELACIRKAVAISDGAFAEVLRFLRPGVTEIAVAAQLEQVMRESGAERPAFETIVASGVRGSLPHGTATEKLLAAGEFVTMDFGAVYRGYHSDVTRTVCLGRASDRQKDLYGTVLRAQLLGIGAIREGVPGRAVDKVARDCLKEKGYGENFGHGLGHSLGLEIHEEPRLSPLSNCERLERGMIVTVEPGVYLPGWGGLRIEDTVLVSEAGGVPLTKSSKELIEIM